MDSLHHEVQKCHQNLHIVPVELDLYDLYVTIIQCLTKISCSWKLVPSHCFFKSYCIAESVLIRAATMSCPRLVNKGYIDRRQQRQRCYWLTVPTSSKIAPSRANAYSLAQLVFPVSTHLVNKFVLNLYYLFKSGFTNNNYYTKALLSCFHVTHIIYHPVL